MRRSRSRMHALRANLPPRLTLELIAGALACLIGSMAGRSLAQDKPTLKDVLGRVQSENEKKAVEDLVDKLKGAARKPAGDPVPAPSATESPGVPLEPAATAQEPPPPWEAPGASQPPSTPPPKVATPSSPTPAPPREAKPAEIKPDEAVRRAETKEVPSVDLEIFFDYKSADITPKSHEVLTTLGRALSDARLADDAFLIAGHTDAKGGAQYNLELSQRRAESVRQFLIANFHIDAAKLIAKGYAFQFLRNPKDPQAGENRRVQIVNLSKDQRR
jgi:outer membrane protein OmpA-like peptidoglycan-associated protein